MLVLSSPSGAGKSTISRALLNRDPDISMSVSVTTRPIRPGETDGEDYIFVDQEKFEQMTAAAEFLEYATVFENSYGTPKGPVEEILKQGRDVLFDVDWQGTQQLASNAPKDLVSVFILPPSIEELERRLHTRAQDSDEVVKKRMAKATSEMSHWNEYDYIVVNEDVDESVAKVQAILAAERLKRIRQPGMVDFVRGMGVSQPGVKGETRQLDDKGNKKTAHYEE
ncbi:MAG: guanylate kinase [Proteobacteria bacterium]|nr:guanylate kinase [Pseudomonadota bacterium]